MVRVTFKAVFVTFVLLTIWVPRLRGRTVAKQVTWLRCKAAGEKSDAADFLWKRGGKSSVGTCKPNSVRRCRRGDHSSRPGVATRLKRPTRRFGEPSRLARPELPPTSPSLFGLAPCGVCHATHIAARPVRSYRTFSPLPREGRYILCGTGRRMALKPSSRTLSGTLLCGVRTFLPPWRTLQPKLA